MSAAAKRNSLTAGSVFMTVGRVLNIGIGYALNVYLARHLGPSAFGLLAVVLTILAWFELAVAEGLPQWVVRVVDRESTGPIIPGIYGVGQLLFSISLGFVLAALAGPLAELFGQPDQVALFRLSAVDIPLVAMFNLFLATLLGLRAYRHEAIGNTGYNAAKLVATVLLVQSGLSVLGGLLGSIAGSVGGLILAVCLIVFTFRGRPLFSRVSLAPLHAAEGPAEEIAEGAARRPEGNAITGSVYPAVLLACQSLALSADLWIVKAMLPAAEAGFYRASSLIARVPIALSAGLVWSLYSAYSDAHRRGQVERLQHYISQACRLLFAAGGLWVAVVVPTSAALLVTIFSEQYASGTTVLQILAVGGALGMTSAALAPIMIIEGRGRPLVIAAVTLVSLQVAAAIVLTPRVGVTGAALSAATTLGLASVALLVSMRRRLSFPVLKTLAQLLAPALVVSAIAVVLSPPPGIWLLVWYAAATVLYAALMFGTRGLTVDDIHAVREGLR